MAQDATAANAETFAECPDLLTPTHIAEITGMSVQYAHTMRRIGTLPAVQVGKSRWRVPKRRFAAFVNGGTER